MTTPQRTFRAIDAKRERVPLLIGLIGPSGSGKTKSALRLATGIQSVVGGEVYGIDTESRRMLHYADQHRFKHVQFDAPFGSLDYLQAIEWCVAQGAGVVVVDSMSHEHEGPGGCLDLHDIELDRLAGDDPRRREKLTFAAWVKPKAKRRRLISGLLQLNCNFVFCFRAREKVRLARGADPVNLGWMPIAGDEFLFEQTVNCLLLPKSEGVPTWQSDQVGERLMMKRPNYLAHLFPPGRQLDEETGRALAEWAKGDTAAENGALLPAPQGAGERKVRDASPAPDRLAALKREGEEAASYGTDALAAFWKRLGRAEQRALASKKDAEWKPAAELADRQFEPAGGADGL